MSLLFYDGFDSYTSPGQVYEGQATNSGVSPEIGAFGRFSSGGMRLDSSTNWVRKNITPSATIVCGFAFNMDSQFQRYLAAFWQAGTAQCGIYVNADGSFSIYRNPGGTSNLLYTSPTALIPSGQYRFFEAKVTFHTATGSVIVRLDGSALATATGLNNSATGATSADAFSNGAGFSTLGDGRTCSYDDLYILNTSGAQNADFLGDVRSVMSTVTADATSTGWAASTGTALYACVDETPPNDGTDYISSTTTNDIAVFNIAPLPASLTGAGTTIKATMVRWRAGKTDAGSRGLASTIKHNGTSTQGPTAYLAANYVTKQDIYELNPSTGNPWTPTEINASQPGIITAV